ncbi:MAG TPA: cytochrome-c oxidase, cbb3-type subunit III [Rhodobacteraceae bacterium]|nr:cytochrome-c oxidase, cbb3-type subunit III [Paracoccaceae bacterium]
MAKQPEKKEIETTGHSWDGIEEYNNPLPRWWLWTFYATILWGIGYVIAYPAWPLVEKATPGLLGFSTRQEVAKDIQAFKEKNAEIEAKLAQADLTTVTEDADLHSFAINSGAAVFRTYCSQCHGSGAAGAKGYPNLLDDDWLWGGDIESIAYTVRHGIRSRSDETRYSEMPAFGEFMSEEEIGQVVHYVLSLGGNEHDASLAGAGATIYADNCASCHGEDGTGDREQGAPNLTDAIWLFGDSIEDITYTVTHARNVEMPTWGDRLSDAQINAVATYVHQLGGGE